MYKHSMVDTRQDIGFFGNNGVSFLPLGPPRTPRRAASGGRRRRSRRRTVGMQSTNIQVKQQQHVKIL